MNIFYIILVLAKYKAHSFNLGLLCTKITCPYNSDFISIDIYTTFSLISNQNQFSLDYIKINFCFDIWLTSCIYNAIKLNKHI